MYIKSGSSDRLSGWVITEDVPGESVRLNWQGESPKLWLRRLGTLGFVLAGMAWVNTAWYLVREWNAGKPGQLREDVILAGLTASFFLYVFHVYGSVMGRLVGYWRELTWTADSQSFAARRRGWLMWGKQSLSIPFQNISHVSLRLAEEQGGVASLTINANDDQSRFDLSSMGFDRSAGLQWLLSIGRVMKSEGYYLAENSAGEFVVQLWRNRSTCFAWFLLDESDSEAFHPIPSVGTAVPLKAPRKPKRVDLVKCKVPLDLERVSKSLAITKIDTWRPGELVRITRPAAPWYLYVLVVGISLIPAFFVGRSWVFSFVKQFVLIDNAARGITAGFTMAFVGLLIGFWLWNNLKIREVILDWTRRRLTLRFGRTLRHWSFSEIREVMLAEKLHNECLEDPEEKTPYRVDGYGSAIYLSLPGEELLMIETELWEKEKPNAEVILAPMGRTLAKELNLRYSPGRPKLRDANRVAKALKLTVSQSILLGLLACVAFGLLVSVGVQSSAQNQKMARLAELGVDAKHMGSFDFDKHRVLENYVKIHFVDGRSLKEHGEEIHSLLQAFPRIELDLEHSNLSDADLEPLRGLKISMLRMSDTRLGDVAVQIACEGDSLEFFEADGTAITDQSVPSLLRQPQLRFAFFRRTQIQFQAAGQIRGKDSIIKAAP